MILEAMLLTWLLTPITQTAPEAAATKPATPAKSASVMPLVERMQKFYETTADFTARFEQQYTYKTFKRKQSSAGTVVFKKPGQMRWDYQQPSAKVFVLSGERAYAYDPEALTLSKTAINTSTLSASVTFLFGRGRLADEFNITQGECKDCLGQGVLLVLSPKKPDPRFKQVKLEVDPSSAQVTRSIVIDPDGSENAIRFFDLKTNVGASADTFRIEPKAGTQIIDMTAPKQN
jgi:outer membrane lipoprotein carrier protein